MKPLMVITEHFKAESGKFVRDNFFGRDPRTAAMVANWSDDQIWNLKRGGHDYQEAICCIHSGYTKEWPHQTVILC